MPRLRTITAFLVSITLLDGLAVASLATAAEPQLSAAQKERLVESEKLLRQAMELQKQGKSRDGLPLVKQSVAIRNEVFGDRSTESIIGLVILGGFLKSMGDYEAAHPYLEQAIALSKEILGEKHAMTANSTHLLGALFQVEGKLPAARTYYERAFAIRKEVLGEKHLDTVDSLESLGDLLRELKDYAAARTYYEQALAINKEIWGEKTRTTAISLTSLGVLHQDMKEYALARSYHEQALIIRKEVLGENHRDTVASLNALRQSNPEFAITVDESKLTAGQKDRLAEADRLNDQIAMLCQQGKEQDAIPVAEMELAIRLEVLGTKHPDTARSLKSLGALHYALRNFEVARTYYEKALVIRKEVLGEKHADTAASLYGLGSLLFAMDDCEAARHFYEQALVIRREVLGEKHPDTAWSLINLGLLLKTMGKNEVARPYLEAALAIRKESFGDNHPETIEIRRSLESLTVKPQQPEQESQPAPQFNADRLDRLLKLRDQSLQSSQQGKLREAISLTEEALKFHKENFGEGLSYPDLLVLLSSLLRNHGDYSAAVSYLKQALALYRSSHGENDPVTMATRSYLDELLKCPDLRLNAKQRERLSEAARLIGKVAEFYQQNKMVEATAFSKQALEIKRTVLGDSHPDTAHAIDLVGDLLHAHRDYAAAQPYYEQTLAIRRAILSEIHPYTAQSLNKLGDLCRTRGDYDAAKLYLLQALSIQDIILGRKHPATATSLNDLGTLFTSMGDDAAARRYYEQALSIRKEVLDSIGKEHPDTTVTQSHLKQLEPPLTTAQQERLAEAARLNDQHIQYFREGKVQDAIAIAKQVLAIRTEILGEEHRDIANSLDHLGYLLQNEGDYAAAQPYYEQALTVRKEVLGDTHPDTASSLYNLGFVFHASDNFAVARPYYEQALAVRRTVLGEKHLATARSLHDLGSLLSSMGDDGAARTYYEKSLAINRELGRGNQLDTALCLDNLGQLYQRMGDVVSAEIYYHQALTIRKELLGEKHPDTVATLSNLANLKAPLAAFPRTQFPTTGDWDRQRSEEKQGIETLLRLMDDNVTRARLPPAQMQRLAEARRMIALMVPLLEKGDHLAALSYLKQALEIRREVLGENHPIVATTLYHLGVVLNSLDEPGKARIYLEQALAIQKNTLGEKHSNTALSLNQLGGISQAMGDYSAARQYYEQALTINKEVFGEKHLNTMQSLNSLGILHQSTGDYGKARSYLERALAIAKEIKGEQHPDTALLLASIGGLLTGAGDYYSAHSYLVQALAINKSDLGEKHRGTLLVLNNLGMLFQYWGDYNGARLYLEQALAISVEVLGEINSSTIAVKENLCCLFAAGGDWPKALNYQQTARFAGRHRIMRELPAMSPNEQLTFLRNLEEGPFHYSLALGLVRCREIPEACRLSAGWLLNGKAVAQESLSQQAILTVEASDPAVRDQVTQLLSLRRQLASLSMAVPKPGEEQARFDRLAQLEKDEQALGRQVSQAVGRPVSQEPWIELDRVRAQLPTKSVLVDIARFGVFNFAAKGNEPKWKAAHYAAWLTPHAGEVQIVDLGEAEPIEAQVKAVRESLKASMGKQGTIFLQGEPEAEKLVQAELKKLAKLIFQPLLPHLQDKDELVLSPDGALWLVPWGALPVADGKYAIEQYRMRYVVSGRDLVRQTASVKNTTNPIVLAAPDYDLNPQQAQATAKSVLGDKYVAPEAGEWTVRSANLLPQVAALPGTYVEAQAIRPQLQNYAQSEPTLYTDRQALENVFKTVKRPKVLVLATHGFFLEDQEVKPQENALAMAGETRSLPLTTKGKPVENPLLRCGLLLAGCNQPASQGDDGILTGLEIVGTDLVGTELVVLSACETGVGEVRNGEGVAGLRQAFQLAGAESVVATLWQVPDRDSVMLMSQFFRNLAAGQSKADALRDSQLSAIAKRRERSGAAHPFFWAAYTITGK